jgi:hypothetical protein
MQERLVKATLDLTPATGVTRLYLNRLCLLAIQSAFVAACASAIPPTPAAGAAPGMPRVRDNGDPSIAALILEATERSATFRHLVRTIDATDGIVYVQQGKCRRGAQAYLVLTVTMAGPHRILRIIVDTRRDRTALMAAIGHELRHAVEVLGDRAVTSDRAIYFFYQREGPTGRERFETAAARLAGSQVFAELTTR